MMQFMVFLCYLGFGLVFAIPIIEFLWVIIAVIKAIVDPTPIPQQPPVQPKRKQRFDYYDDWEDDDDWDDDYDCDYDDEWDEDYDDEYNDDELNDVYVFESTSKQFVKKEKDREQDFKEAWMFRESRYEVGDYCRICHKLIESGECEHYTPWWKINLGKK